MKNVMMTVYFKCLIIMYGETDKNFKLRIIQYCDLVLWIVFF
jgi:hypothetical protein